MMMRFLCTLLLMTQQNVSLPGPGPFQTITSLSPTPILSTQTGIANGHSVGGTVTNVVNPGLVIPVSPPLGTVGGAHNCLIVVAHLSNTWTLGTPTDNIGGDTYTAVAGATGTQNTIVFKTWIVFGDPAGITAVTVPSTGSASGTNTYFGGWAKELKNGCTSTGGTGFLGFTANGAVNNLTLSSAPTSGDTVFAFAADTTFSGTEGTCLANTITVGSGYTPDSYSTCYGKFSEFDSSTTSTSVPITYAGTDSIGMVALVIQKGAAGTSPPASKYVDHQQAENIPGTGTTPTLQFPSSGNLAVGLFNAGNSQLASSVTSTNAGSPTFATTCNITNSNAPNAASQIFYSSNAALTSTTTITPTLSAAGAGIQIELYSITNANSSSFVKCSAGSTPNHTAAGNFTADTITPTNATGDFVFNTAALDFHTTYATVTDGNSHTPVVAAAIENVDDDANPGCTGGLATPPSTLSEDNGYAVFKTTNVTLLSFIYSGSWNGAGSCQTNPTGTGQDSSISAEFK